MSSTNEKISFKSRHRRSQDDSLSIIRPRAGGGRRMSLHNLNPECCVSSKLGCLCHWSTSLSAFHVISLSRHWGWAIDYPLAIFLLHFVPQRIRGCLLEENVSNGYLGIQLSSKMRLDWKMYSSLQHKKISKF